MPRKHGCLRTAMIVRPEHRRSLPSMATRHTVRSEHKKQPVGCFYLSSSNMLNVHEYYLNSGYASIPQSDLSIPSYSSSSVTRIPITFLSTNHATKLAVNTQINMVAAPIN